MSKDDKGDLSRAGSAALFGFLYQLTASAHQVVHAQVEDDAKAAGAMTITAILEPVAGGDLVVNQGNGKKAIQYKYRSSPLPAADLVGSVLPDLFRAHCAGPLVAYELQCSNTISAAAITALEAVRAAGAIVGPKANRFAREARDACLEIWKANHGGDDDGFADAYVLFLERFRIANRLLPSRVWEELRGWILPKVAYQGDAEAVLTQMLGELVRLCRNNDQVISVATLLRAVGLERMAQLTPAEQRVRLKETAIATLDGAGFDPALDVRDELRVSETDALTLIRGGSGCGKSWALYRLASGMIERDTPVVLVRAKSLRELKERVKAVVVAGALGEDRPYELPSIGGVWRRFQSRPGDMIWVLWEGCGSLDDLEEVARAGGLGEGLALVAEVPPYVGSDQADDLSAASFPVGLFTQVELVQALARRGLNAAEIPGEIQKMLFLPVLCDIYAQTVRDTPSWAPHNEYLVLEEFWRRARKKGGLGTEGRLKALAGALMDGNVTSVDDAVTEAFGFTEARLEVLQAAGWLATDGQAWGFAHDRLMTWACAKALVDMVKSGDVSAEMLSERIDILTARPSARGALGGLGFLMMDVIWLLAGEADRTDPMDKLIRRFEVKDGRVPEEFYSDLLPTCGARILPAIERRLEALDGTEDIHFQIGIVDGLIALDPPSPDRDRIVAGLWNHPASTARDIVLRLGRTWPLTAIRQEAWRVYIRISPTTMPPYDAGRDKARFARVIRRLATDDPSWVIALFEVTSDDTELHGLAHLLSDLDAAIGRPIWLVVKAKLVSDIPAVNGAVLATCAEHFLDRDFADHLVDLCRDDGWSGWKAFGAICALAPETALRVIETSPPNRQFVGGGDWFDLLLDFDAPRATAAVERWLFEIDPSGRTFADVWWHYAGRAQESVISRLAAMFQAQLSGRGNLERTDRIQIAILGHKELPEAGEAWLGQSADPALGNAVLDETRRIEPDETTQRKGVELSYQCQTAEILLALKSLLPVAKRNRTKSNLWTETWRAIRPMDPDFWWSSMKAFLVGDDDDDRVLALTLLDDEDTSALEPELQTALEKSAPDTDVEASALDVIRNDHVQNPVALSRVQAREAGGLSFRIVDLNILLNSTADAAVESVSRHLSRMLTATSWSSTDFQALEIHLRTGNADDALWEFAERHLASNWFGKSDLASAFMEKRADRVLPHLLERVYSRPGMFTDVQPDALEHLASRWPELAADAFDLCWRRSSDRRLTLTHLIRMIGQTAVRTVISDVLRDPEAYSEDKKLMRRVGYQLRNLADLARQSIDDAYPDASDSSRAVLCTLTAWLPDSEGRLAELAAGEGSGRVRSHALRLIWKHRARADAIRAFREKPTVGALLKTIEMIDPVILFRKGDTWDISSIVLSDIGLLLFAEANVGRRFHEINGDRNRRLRFGRHLLPPDA